MNIKTNYPQYTSANDDSDMEDMEPMDMDLSSSDVENDTFDIDADNNDDLDDETSNILDFFSFSVQNPSSSSSSSSSPPPPPPPPLPPNPSSSISTSILSPTTTTSHPSVSTSSLESQNATHLLQLEPQPSPLPSADVPTAAYPIITSLLSIPLVRLISTYMLAIWHMSVFSTVTNLGQVNENSVNWFHPFVYLRLLTYPAGASSTSLSFPITDPVNQQPNSLPNRSSQAKASFSVLRETHLVQQRRKLVSSLIIYTIVMRYCSLDSFMILLFLSSCTMLYFMKNSRKINVQLAKKNLKQRVGWAKQWAGGLFKRQNDNEINQQDHQLTVDTLADQQHPLSSPHDMANPISVRNGRLQGAQQLDKKRSKRVIAAFRGGKLHPNSSSMLASSTNLLGSGQNVTTPTSAISMSKSSRRINSLFRRAASVEPTSDKANPFTVDGSVGKSEQETPSNPPTTLPAPSTSTVPVPVPTINTTHMTLHGTNSSETDDVNNVGAKAKLSRIFNRRRVNSSAPPPGPISSTSKRHSINGSGTLYTLTSQTNDEMTLPLSQPPTTEDKLKKASLTQLSIPSTPPRPLPSVPRTSTATTPTTTILTLSGLPSTGVNQRYLSLSGSVLQTDLPVSKPNLQFGNPELPPCRSVSHPIGEITIQTSQSYESVAVLVTSPSPAKHKSNKKQGSIGHNRSASDGYAATISSDEVTPLAVQEPTNETLMRSTSHHSKNIPHNGTKIASVMKGKAKGLWEHVKSSTTSNGSIHNSSLQDPGSNKGLILPNGTGVVQSPVEQVNDIVHDRLDNKHFGSTGDVSGVPVK